MEVISELSFRKPYPDLLSPTLPPQIFTPANRPGYSPGFLHLFIVIVFL